MDNQSGHLHLHNQPTLLQVTVQLIYYKGVTCPPPLPCSAWPSTFFFLCYQICQSRSLHQSCSVSSFFFVSQKTYFASRAKSILHHLESVNIKNQFSLFHFSLIFKEFWKTSWALGIGSWWERICSDIFCGSFVFKGRTPFNCVFCPIKENRFGKKLTNKPMLSSFQHTKPHPFQSIWHIYMDRCRQT